jgi:hypothetical protein
VFEWWTHLNSYNYSTCYSWIDGVGEQEVPILLVRRATRDGWRTDRIGAAGSPAAGAP